MNAPYEYIERNARIYKMQVGTEAERVVRLPTRFVLGPPVSAMSGVLRKPTLDVAFIYIFVIVLPNIYNIEVWLALAISASARPSTVDVESIADPSPLDRPRSIGSLLIWAFS